MGGVKRGVRLFWGSINEFVVSAREGLELVLGFGQVLPYFGP